MQSKRKRPKIILLVIVLISIVFLASDVWAELKLVSVDDKIGVIGEPLETTLTGTGFNENTRVTMAIDSGNKEAIVSEVDTGDSAHGIAISGDGNIAYVADGESGLIVINISIPESPQVIGSIDTPDFDFAHGIAISGDGNIAYVADGKSGLQVIDVSTPYDPQKLGAWRRDVQTPGEARDVSVSGSNAYVADHSGGLRIIDVSIPESPKIIDTVDTPDINGDTTDAYGVTVVNATAYVTYHLDSSFKLKGGLQVIDISNPSRPTKIGNKFIDGKARDVTVVGNYAYVANDSEGLTVIDISDPADPKLEISTPTSYNAYDVTVVDDRAYVADFLGGVFVIDISSPTNPQAIGSVDTPGFAYSLALEGSNAYVAAGASGLQVIDITTPNIQQVIGRVDPKGLATKFAIVDDDIVYLAGGFAGLHVINISIPEDLKLVKTVPFTGDTGGVTVADDYAYVAAGNSGLHILNITTPSDPQKKGNLDKIGFARSVAVEGNIAYVAATDKVQVINVSTPSSPQLIHSVPKPRGSAGSFVDVTVSGNIAYVAARDGGLYVIDISTPSKAKIINTVGPFSEGCNEISDKYWANYFAVDATEQLGYLAYGLCGLYVFDIIIPDKPKLIGRVLTPSNALHVIVKGDTAYVSDADSGLQVIDINPDSSMYLKIIGSVDTAGAAVYAAIEGDKAYVSDYNNGFLVVPLPVDVTPPPSDISPTTMLVTLPSPPLVGDYILRVFNQSESHELPGAVTFILPKDAPRIFGQKAIIMAGDGNVPGDDLAPSFQYLAEAAYDALDAQGYLAEDIYYLTPDDTNDNWDADPTSANLSYAINTWAKEQDDPKLSELLLYITGHGLPGEFNPKPDDSLLVGDLKIWLDDLQKDIDCTGNTRPECGRVIFIYDACYSGSFLKEMQPPIGKQRISITSSTSSELATIADEGSTSFSDKFWRDIKFVNDGKLVDALNSAKNFMKYDQTAWLDENGNSNPNEQDDIISDVVILRRGSTPGRDRPTIDQVSQEQSLQGQPTATFWAKGITGSSDISKVKVYARIFSPPPCDPEPTLPDGTAITNSQTEVLNDFDDDGTYTYEGDFDFSATGAYRISIFALDEGDDLESKDDDLESYSKDTFVYQSYGPDCYENDDTYEQANSIIVGDRTPQRHNFYSTGDEDWVTFYGIAGRRYVIEAKDLFPHADVVLEIYADTDPTTPLEDPQNSIGDPNANETINWRCPHTGVFYVKVRPYSSDYTGEGTDYNLKVYEQVASISGWLLGNVKDKISGLPVPKPVITTYDENDNVHDATRGSSKGYYQISHDTGPYRVTAKAPGYIEEIYPEDVIVVKKEKNPPSINFALAPKHTAPIDTDGDGMPDTWENQYGFNPSVDDASADADKDGYTNLEEYLGGSNPRDPNDPDPQPAYAMPWLFLLLDDE